ncbi:hypothetical protein SAMN05444143_102176 [Flavobacterium succinicans]|uniref:Uncharacterized protein n=1 Tax=Flavobacterium succinicans TaxID=29536 RepID=A0A1I4TM42_9FLAO|nr:hypothetical protein SAMN05444143_102176 [Flavobacterium succinicans]
MTQFIIKTHQRETLYKENQIFILNKGFNSGKPQKRAFQKQLYDSIFNSIRCNNS